jgi:hypothetical protein
MDDDLIDRLVEHHPGFRRLLERRLKQRSVWRRWLNVDSDTEVARGVARPVTLASDP